MAIVIIVVCDNKGRDQTKVSGRFFSLISIYIWWQRPEEQETILVCPKENKDGIQGIFFILLDFSIESLFSEHAVWNVTWNSMKAAESMERWWYMYYVLNHFSIKYLKCVESI